MARYFLDKIDKNMKYCHLEINLEAINDLCFNGLNFYWKEV